MGPSSDLSPPVGGRKEVRLASVSIFLVKVTLLKSSLLGSSVSLQALDEKPKLLDWGGGKKKVIIVMI